MQNQMNTVTEECNAAEVAICLLRTELVEARNVTNVLAYAAATTTTATTIAAATTTTAPAPTHTVDKIPFPNKFDGT